MPQSNKATGNTLNATNSYCQVYPRQSGGVTGNPSLKGVFTAGNINGIIKCNVSVCNARHVAEVASAHGADAS